MPARPAKPKKRTPGPASAASFGPGEVAAAARAIHRGHARTPKEVSEAFAPRPVAIAGETLRPLSIASLIILEQIESPLADENFGPETEVTARDMMAVIFILTRDPEASSELLGAGRKAFDDAVLKFCTKIPLGELGPITQRLREVFVAAFATLVGGGQKKTEKAPSPPPPTTASAGG